ncbi:longitudinals lacking protein, isoforms A/B/D/L-like [Bemisia tabaci]
MGFGEEASLGATSSAAPARPSAYPTPMVYQCPDCGKAYNYKTSLSRHIRFECGKAPQFVCPFCHHRTKHKSSLLNHISSRHKDSLPPQALHHDTF